MVERSVLAEFRVAVDKIRQTSWNVQHSTQAAGETAGQ
jgi:hypothetical protein